MSENNFANRWSERKRKVAQSELHEAALVEKSVQEQVVEEKSDDEILEEFGLKDPDSLEKGDDFSGFMNSAIPARIRNRALRKLWVSNPAFGVMDGLVEYGEDYTDAATVIENLQTAYQVGKGILNKMTEIESESDISVDECALDDASDVKEIVSDASHSEQSEILEKQSDEPPVFLEVETDLDADGSINEFSAIVKNNRRMRFSFDGDT